MLAVHDAVPVQERLDFGHTLQQQVLEECHSALQVRSVPGSKQQALRNWAVATSEECIAVTAEGCPLLLYDFEVGTQPAKVESPATCCQRLAVRWADRPF